MPLIRDLFASGEPEKRSRMPMLSGTSTGAGVHVTPERSLQVSAVYGSVSLIADAIAQLPVHVYRKDGDQRKRLPDHPILPVVSDMANPAMDASEFWRQMVGFMLLHGNAFAYRVVNGAGRTVELWPVSPTSIAPKRDRQGRLAYEVRPGEDEFIPGMRRGELYAVEANRMLHFRAFTLNMWGISPIQAVRQKIGTAFAAEQYGAGFFSRGAVPGGALATDAILTDEQFERLTEQWAQGHKGFQNSHRLGILEGGVHWQNVGLPPEDAQFLETQKYTAGTIAGHIYRVPPHLIGDVERSTSWGTGIAEQGINFVRFTLMGWINRLERVTNRLFEPGVYMKFNPGALERGDIKARYDAYAVGKQWGWLSTNDIRRLEDQPPVDGGDVYMQPLNMVPAGTFADMPRQTVIESARTLAIEAGGRATSIKDRHIEAHEAALKRVFADQRDAVFAALDAAQSGDLDRDELDAVLADLLARLGLSAATDAAEPIAEMLGFDLDPDSFAGWMHVMGKNVARNINNHTFELIMAATSVDEVRAVFEQLAGGRGHQIAVTRVSDAFGFARQDVARQAGARTKTWVVTSRNPRPSHAAINGETVPIDELFSNGLRWPGDSMRGTADDNAGCTCDLVVSV